MRLKSLELQGFKTFSEKTLITFNNGITAIVGPNGSGKSNISDAIRWVFGEQSTRSIRCSKMEDVIFNGTTEFKAKGFSSVALTILNDDRKLAVNDDEVTIIRKIYRSGENEYLINKKEVRLKDIHEIFMDTGLGRDGYSVVSQGKIDAIISSRNEERREIFEEAAGISKYRYRKEQAKKKLERTEENLLRLNDIFEELENRIIPLREQAKKAKTYVDLANQKKALEIGIWLFTLSKTSDILKNYENKIEIIKEQYNGIERDLEDINLKIENFSKDILVCTVNVDKSFQKISDCEENILKNNGKISVLQNDILHNKKNIERESKEILSLKQKISFIDVSLKEKTEKKSCLENIITKKELELKQKNDLLESLKQKVSETKEKTSNMNDELFNLKNAASELKIKIITAQSNLKELNEKQVFIDQNLKLYEKKIDDTKKEISLVEKSLSEIKIKKEEILLNLDKKFLKINELEKKIIKAKQFADELTLDESTQIRKIQMLEELEKNFDGYSYSVKFLMKETKENKLSEIYGPISKLISVPNKYSTAIETALGAAMQNIVVKTEDSAKFAINLLKNKKIGRLTFLPITTIKGCELNEDSLKNNLGYIGIASQLCECDDIYRNVIKFLLGRIIVMNNLDEATKLAKKFCYKFKIVTIDGQIVNVGGALTGGAIINKNLGILKRKEQIDFLKNKNKELSNKAKCAKDFYINLQNDLLKLKNDFENLKKIESAFDTEYNKIEQNYQKKLIELDSLDLNYKNFLKESSEIIVKTQNVKNFLNDYNESFNKIDGKIEDLEKSLSYVRENKSQAIKEHDSLIKDFNNLNLEITSLNGNFEHLSFECNSVLENKRLFEQQCQNLLNEINELNLKNIDIEEQIKGLENENERLKAVSLRLKTESENFNNEKMNFEKNITELRKLERSDLNEKEKLALEETRLEGKKINIQKEYDEIISKLWDDYEITKSEAKTNYKILENTPQNIKQLNELKLKIKKLGIVNVAAIEEYKQVSERYEFMKIQINDIEKSKKELYKLINDLTKEMKTLFIEKFDQINNNFNSVFKELFGGGSAKISLTDASDVLNSAIEIYVHPPGKIITNLEALSGGERALVAISLYFAIMKVSPSPFCVLDEIEAALDDVNVERFAAYLRKMNKNTQFIVITHRRGTMEEADVLYGVTMQNEGVSKLLELKVSDMAKNL